MHIGGIWFTSTTPYHINKRGKIDNRIQKLCTVSESEVHLQLSFSPYTQSAAVSCWYGAISSRYWAVTEFNCVLLQQTLYRLYSCITSQKRLLNSSSWPDCNPAIHTTEALCCISDNHLLPTAGKDRNGERQTLIHVQDRLLRLLGMVHKPSRQHEFRIYFPNKCARYYCAWIFVAMASLPCHISALCFFKSIWQAYLLGTVFRDYLICQINFK